MFSIPPKGFCTQALGKLYHGLLPSMCVICNTDGAARIDTARPFAGDRCLCHSCAASISRLSISHPCQQCGIMLASAHIHDELCAQCLKQPPAYQSTMTAFEYGHPLDYLLHQFKQANKPFVGKELALLMLNQASILQRVISCTADIVCCVPLDKKRRISRQYNQSEIIARHLLKHAHSTLVFQPQLFSKPFSSSSQQGLNRKQRLANLKGCFCLNGSVEGKHIIIVDDVITTGATAQTLSALAKANGAKQIDLWAVARTPVGE